MKNESRARVGMNEVWAAWPRLTGSGLGWRSPVGLCRAWAVRLVRHVLGAVRLVRCSPEVARLGLAGGGKGREKGRGKEKEMRKEREREKKKEKKEMGDFGIFGFFELKLEFIVFSIFRKKFHFRSI